MFLNKISLCNNNIEKSIENTNKRFIILHHIPVVYVYMCRIHASVLKITRNFCQKTMLLNENQLAEIAGKIHFLRSIIHSERMCIPITPYSLSGELLTVAC